MIAVALPGVCQTIPGIANSLMLDLNSTVVVASGVAGPWPFIPAPCFLGLGPHSLFLPFTMQVGGKFRIQSLSFSQSFQGDAFGPTIECVVL